MSDQKGGDRNGGLRLANRQEDLRSSQDRLSKASKEPSGVPEPVDDDPFEGALEEALPRFERLTELARRTMRAADINMISHIIAAKMLSDYDIPEPYDQLKHELSEEGRALALRRQIVRQNTRLRR